MTPLRPDPLVLFMHTRQVHHSIGKFSWKRAEYPCHVMLLEVITMPHSSTACEILHDACRRAQSHSDGTDPAVPCRGARPS
jgi:hypothetical protein